uniref:Uncharacterized protein n=1 Tax=Alexandrium catenella TaxID=2925 RepID=A0A7S1RLG5_ALECA
MAAWTCEPMPPETFRPAALLPVDDPRLNAPTKSMARRRAEERGLAVWKVVLKPRIAIRDRPATQGKVMDVFYTGDELVITGEAKGPWLRMSEMTWADVTDAPPEAWVLRDGTAIGLGVLLEQVYDPAGKQARRGGTAADEDSAEDSDGSEDAELLEQGA